MRSIKQILKEEQNTELKVWYDRHQLINKKILTDSTPKDIVKGAYKAAKEVEKQFGKKALGPYSDMEWGMLNGRLETLRWVLGADWGMLDT